MRPMKKLTCLLALSGLLGACQGSSTLGNEGSDEADERVSVELLPTPFTAEEIRSACLPGSQLVFEVQAEGQATVRQFIRFVGDDGEQAQIESWTEALDGAPLQPRRREAVPWSELRDHALMPLGSTRERDTVSTELGELEGWHYTQPIADERGQGAREFWFADRFPGPPVLMIDTLDGREVLRMEIVARAMP